MNKNHINYSSITKSLQALKTTITEIVASGTLTDNEILSIRYWMDDNKHLSGNYPFDKIYSMIDDILSDGVIDSEERESLLSILENEKICNSLPFTIDSLAGYHVCLTGNFTFSTRKELEDLLLQYCVFIEKNVNVKTAFVFVGELGNNDWAYGNYGNKIKRAKELQEQGHSILILSEDILKSFLENHVPPKTYNFEQYLNILNNLPDEARQIVYYEIKSTINGFSGFISKHNEIIDLLINENILCKTEDENTPRNCLRHLSRNELNTRIENLSLGIIFKKNMKLEDLIDWCFANIPDHINELTSDFIQLKLHDSFLNPKVLVALNSYWQINS